MLVILLWALTATLALGEGLLVLFLIRSRSHSLTVAGEIIKLQQAVGRLDKIENTMNELRSRLESATAEAGRTAAPQSMDDCKIIRLAAVGGKK